MQAQLNSGKIIIGYQARQHLGLPAFGVHSIGEQFVTFGIDIDIVHVMIRINEKRKTDSDQLLQRVHLAQQVNLA